MLAFSGPLPVSSHLSFLYGVNATDAPTFIGAAALLAVVAAMACILPARRALRVDVNVTLREF